MFPKIEHRNTAASMKWSALDRKDVTGVYDGRDNRYVGAVTIPILIIICLLSSRIP